MFTFNTHNPMEYNSVELIITMQDTKANLHSCVTTTLMVKATTMNTNTKQTAPPLLKHAYVLLTARVAKSGMKSADL